MKRTPVKARTGGYAFGHYAPVPELLFKRWSEFGLSASHLAVLLTVVSACGSSQHTLDSYERMATWLGLTRNGFRKACYALQKAGLLSINPRFYDGRQTSNVISVRPLWERLAEKTGRKPKSKPEEPPTNVIRAEALFQ
jgi:hypothetical protein